MPDITPSMLPSLPLDVASIYYLHCVWHGERRLYISKNEKHAKAVLVWLEDMWKKRVSGNKPPFTLSCEYIVDLEKPK